MRFAEMEGNGAVMAALRRMVDSARVPHAILLHEDDGGGGVAMALSFLQYLYCRDRSGGDSCGTCPACNKISKMIHPDVHFIFPVTTGTLSVSYAAQWRDLVKSNPYFTEYDLGAALGIEGKSTMIAVAEAKALIEKLSLYALEGGYRSVLIYLPEKMNAEAANRLLKLIEEPPAMTEFLLVTHAPEKVLPTISSRCQRIRIQPRKGAGMQTSEESVALLASLMEAELSRNLTSALEVCESIAAIPSRDGARMFCKYASDRMRELFLHQQGLSALSSGDADVASWAKRCRKTFPRHALGAFDRAALLVDRNVNVKIIFAELACSLYRIV